jgi:hypothetical protein
VPIFIDHGAPFCARARCTRIEARLDRSGGEDAEAAGRQRFV